MAERFWKRYLNRSGLSLWSLLVPVMWGVSGLYYMGNQVHRALIGRPKKVQVPVISIGNVSIGGTGKTPVVAFLAKELSAKGIRIGVVSSGYGRKSPRSVLGTGAELAQMSTDEIGDEIKSLAQQFPQLQFSIDRSKAEAAEQISKSGTVDLMLVDDGFQHYGLHRDLDIILWDASTPGASMHLLPNGVLREPLSALDRAGVVIFTRVDQSLDFAKVRDLIASRAPYAQTFESRFIHTELIGRSTRYPMTFLNKRRVIVFAGIGNFSAFRRQVETAGAVVVSALEFDDHQQYDRIALQKIADLAIEKNADIIVTTGKDQTKLGDFDFGRECCYLGLDLELSPSGDALVEAILHKMNMKDVHH